MSARRKQPGRPKPRPGPQRVDMRVELSIEGRPVSVAAPVPEGPTRPRRMLPLLRELADAVIQIGVDAAAARGEPMSCRLGCAACCRQLVPLSPAEAHDLRARLGALPAERRRELDARFDAARARLVEAGLYETLRHPERVSEDDKESVAQRYLALWISCPFLEAETCSIHAERPFACREYLVTSEPQHCSAPMVDTIRMLPLAGELSTALARSEATGDGPAPWVPLVVAPEWTAEHPDEGPARPASEMLQRVLDHLAEGA